MKLKVTDYFIAYQKAGHSECIYSVVKFSETRSYQLLHTFEIVLYGIDQLVQLVYLGLCPPPILIPQPGRLQVHVHAHNIKPLHLEISCVLRSVSGGSGVKRGCEGVEQS